MRSSKRFTYGWHGRNAPRRSAQSAGRARRSTITESGSGGTWIRANFRRGFMRGCHGFRAHSMGSCRFECRGLERRELGQLTWLGVDEKSFLRRHNYVTIVTDLEEPRVLFVADDRKQQSLEAFWAMGLSASQRTALEAIAMDMWAPYVQATRAQVPDADAKIVFDRFHCAKHLNEGVDRVRRAEHRASGRGAIPA